MDNDTEGVLIHMQRRRVDGMRRCYSYGVKGSLEFKDVDLKGSVGISDLLQGYRIGFGISQYNVILSYST